MLQELGITPLNKYLLMCHLSTNYLIESDGAVFILVKARNVHADPTARRQVFGWDVDLILREPKNITS